MNNFNKYFLTNNTLNTFKLTSKPIKNKTKFNLKMNQKFALKNKIGFKIGFKSNPKLVQI